MKDKDIRKILIEYLKATSGEIRIFQEKNIGNSVCDIMAVTDILTGYEIKSDADNYERLSSQVMAYNKFFDKNYIVVGSSHSEGVKSRVPYEWGIIVITEEGPKLVRSAKPNKNVKVRSQLSILWKLELKNLLIKNNLPAYAQKEKGYIADRLAEDINADVLSKQIVYELMHRDYSVYQAEDFTVKQESKEVSGNFIAENLPEQEIVDTLSEEDLSEFTLDRWIAIYNRAKLAHEKKNNIYQERKIVLTDHKIHFKDIRVTPGVPWISQNMINEFIHYLLGYDTDKYKINFAGYEPVTGFWHVNHKSDIGITNPATYIDYGTRKYNALMIIEAMLNLRTIKVYDTDRKINEKETIAANAKQEKIRTAFRQWIEDDETRKWLVEEEYNKIFADYEKEECDGSSLVFPEMSGEYHLYDYQKDAVKKIISNDNTLLAFDVGAGKTYIMIAAAMKMRESGLSYKNLFVVPNNIVGQWEKIFTSLYPKAKVLTVEPKTFRPEMRSKVLKQVKNGDYDGIIIAYSCFEMIPLSADFVADKMKSALREINKAIDSLKDGQDFAFAPLDRKKDYIKKLTQQLIDSVSTSNDTITFDQLEINTIFLDEAHNFKNVPIRTSLKNIVGINTVGSAKCQQMMAKVRCVQSQNGGRGAVFATGTPLCNSIADTYVMQMYLQEDELKKHNLHIFDNWVKTFARPEEVCEIDVDTSRFRFIERFAEFYNLPELSAMFSQIAIFHAVDESDLPDFEKYSDTIIKKSSKLNSYMKQLCERTEKIRSKDVDRTKDNMLKVSTDGRKAALDLRLVGLEQKYDSHSKIFRCVENVIGIYNKYNGCSQLIFCDYSTPKTDIFNVYNELKDRLTKKGIPKNEIAFIHSCKSESTKLKLYDDVNNGKVRILIGSTFKLGIGANVQTKLKAIHHLDVPWRPADMIQREGRILRRGNENKEIEIHRYISEGSFDAYSWQVLETKQKFISQFLDGSSYQRTSEDLENNVLTYAQVKALALDEPLMKQLAEAENEIRNLTLLKNQEDDEKKKAVRRLENLESDYHRLKENNREAIYHRDYISELSKAELKAFKSELGSILTAEFISSENQNLWTGRFNFRSCGASDEKKKYVNLIINEAVFPIEMGNSPDGNAVRVINFMKKFGEYYTTSSETLKNLMNAIDSEVNLINSPCGYETLLNEKKSERDRIYNMILINSGSIA